MADPNPSPPRSAAEPDPPADFGTQAETRAQPGAASLAASRRISEPSLGPPARRGDLGSLGPYRVLRKLGQGGMGAVYLGHDSGLDRPVALKVMLPKHAADPEFRARFLLEAKSAARVRSDHVVTVFQVGEAGGAPFIAMEYLDGHPLDEYLRRHGRLTVPQLLRVAREAATGLAAAHALGIVHRDIKPANLWLEAPNGRVKILDFGLAKPVAGADGLSLSGSGLIVGTPAYMAPEQAAGRPLDGRADLFSLGCVLYRLATGRPAFDGPDGMAILNALATQTPRPVRESAPDMPPGVEGLIHWMLVKDAGGRPDSAGAVVDAVLRLERAMSHGEVSVVDPVPLAAAASMPDFVIPDVAIPVSARVPAPNVFAEITEAAPRSYTHKPLPPRRVWAGWAAAGVSLAAVLAVGAGAFLALRPAAPTASTADADPHPATRPTKKTPATIPEPPVHADVLGADVVFRRGGHLTLADGREARTRDDLPPPPLAVDAITVAVGARDRVTDADLKELAAAPFAAELRKLILIAPDVTEAGMDAIARMPNLDLLALKSVPLKPGGAKHLARLRGLKHLSLAGGTVDAAAARALRDSTILTLDLSSATVPDAALGEFRQLHALDSLDLNNTPVGNAGVEALRGMPGLHVLRLVGTRVTADAAPALADLPALHRLALDQTPVTDAVLRAVGRRPAFVELGLGQTDITDAGLDHLVGHPLEVLNLARTRLTDEAVDRLAKMKRLRLLNLGGVPMRRAAADRLRAALPECRIIGPDIIEPDSVAPAPRERPPENP